MHDKDCEFSHSPIRLCNCPDSFRNDIATAIGRTAQLEFRRARMSNEPFDLETFAGKAMEDVVELLLKHPMYLVHLTNERNERIKKHAEEAIAASFLRQHGKQS